MSVVISPKIRIDRYVIGIMIMVFKLSFPSLSSSSFHSTSPEMMTWHCRKFSCVFFYLQNLVRVRFISLFKKYTHIFVVSIWIILNQAHRECYWIDDVDFDTYYYDDNDDDEDEPRWSSWSNMNHHHITSALKILQDQIAKFCWVIFVEPMVCVSFSY